MRRACAAIALVAGLLAAAPAQAGTVTAYRPPCAPEQSKYGQCYPDEARFTADPGETNHVTVGRSVDPPDYQPKITITDSGALLTAAGGCAQIDDHTAECTGYLMVAVLSLGDGNDYAEGPATVDAGPGDDVVNGSGVIRGGPGNDRLTGGGGNDTLIGGPGADVLSGGGGNDTLQPDDGEGGEVDTVDGGPGTDVVSYAARKSGVTVSLQQPAGNEDRLTGIESIRGGDGNDILTGDAGANTLEGGAGNDLLRGGNGADVIDGGPGTDVIDGGAGSDTLYSGEDRTARNRITCGSGVDRVATVSVNTLVESDCEMVAETAFDLVLKSVSLHLPLRTRRQALLSLDGLACVERPCTIDMRVTIGSGRGSVLAARRESYRKGRKPPRRIDLLLSAAGASLLERRAPVDARVTLAVRDGIDRARSSFLVSLSRPR